MPFEIIGPIRAIETIAHGRAIRCLERLQKSYGRGFWRKRKGQATIILADGFMTEAELHWYKAAGIGRREVKLKRLWPGRP